MKKLRWTTDGGGSWDVDVSTPSTLTGIARPVPGDPIRVLGVSRGPRLSRPKQVDFLQMFMFVPVVPSFSLRHHGISLQRVLSLPSPLQPWFGTLLAQFNIQKFVSSIKENGLMKPCESSSSSSSSSWLNSIGRHLRDKSLYALDFCSELEITPDSTLQVSSELYGDGKKPRKRAVLQHKFPHHNLTVEGASPGLFLDKDGSYWDVPFAMAIDLASVASDEGLSYHMCINQTAGSPEEVEGQKSKEAAAALLPGLSATSAFSFKKNLNIWKSEAAKLKMVQPYDLFLSNPHVTASGILGAVVTASFGDKSLRAQVKDEPSHFEGLKLSARGSNSSIVADLFASVSLSAQYGNFQRLFLDLTRFNARLDFPRGSAFLSSAARLAKELYKSEEPSLEAIQGLCPSATLSFQQQIAGPFSFRVDSSVELDLQRKDQYLTVRDPTFALEYALQVLGSAKAMAWYSPKQKEFMIELRFFER